MQSHSNETDESTGSDHKSGITVTFYKMTETDVNTLINV